MNQPSARRAAKEAITEDMAVALDSAGSLEAVPSAIRNRLDKVSNQIENAVGEEGPPGFAEEYEALMEEVLRVMDSDLPVEERLEMASETVWGSTS